MRAEGGHKERPTTDFSITFIAKPAEKPHEQPQDVEIPEMTVDPFENSSDVKQTQLLFKDSGR